MFRNAILRVGIFMSVWVVNIQVHAGNRTRSQTLADVFMADFDQSQAQKANFKLSPPDTLAGEQFGFEFSSHSEKCNEELNINAMYEGKKASEMELCISKREKQYGPKSNVSFVTIYNCTMEFHKNFDDYLFKEMVDVVLSCHLACTLKRLKILNDKGMFDPEVAKHLTETLVVNPVTQEKLTNFREICIGVNKKDVSDGDLGCDRAKLLHHCYEDVYNIKVESELIQQNEATATTKIKSTQRITTTRSRFKSNYIVKPKIKYIYH